VTDMVRKIRPETLVVKSVEAIESGFRAVELK